MAELSVTSISASGIADAIGGLSAADAAGDQVAAAGGLLIVVNNGDASSKTLTVTKPAASINVSGYGSVDLDDRTLTVAAGDVGFISIPSKYASGSNFEWAYDSVTSVTVGVFSIAP